MGWLPSLESMADEPKNMVDEKWRKFFYLSSHKLALHKKSLAPLLFASTSSFLDLQSSIQAINESVATDTLTQIENTTKVLTLLNPHHYTAWNIRKRLILRFSPSGAEYSHQLTGLTNTSSAQIQGACEKELLHISLALSKQPKSVEAWAHRKWVLHTLESVFPKPINSSREISLCDYSINAHKRNYYAWTHRLYTLQHWIDPKTSEGSLELQEDLARTWKWLTLHIADASAAHHCEIALKRIVASDMDVLTREEVKEGDLNFAELLQATAKYLDIYNAGETWWTLRRALLVTAIDMYPKEGEHRLLKWIQDEFTFNASQLSSSTQGLFALRHLVWIIGYLQVHRPLVYDSLSEDNKQQYSDAQKDLTHQGWMATLSQ